MNDIAKQLMEATITKIEIEKSDGSKISCYLRDLSAGDVLDFVSYDEGPERNEALLELIAKAVIDENKNPVFTGKDMSGLRDMPVKIFEQLSSAVISAAGLETEIEEDAEGNA